MTATEACTLTLKTRIFLIGKGMYHTGHPGIITALTLREEGGNAPLLTIRFDGERDENSYDALWVHTLPTFISLLQRYESGDVSSLEMEQVECGLAVGLPL